jgi:hypothetical protein
MFEGLEQLLKSINSWISGIAIFVQLTKIKQNTHKTETSKYLG